MSAVDGEYDGENNESHRDSQQGDTVGHVPEQQAVFVPSQHEELEMLTVLSKDAAEILWEMVLMNGGGDPADLEDMKGRAEQLRAQLRGMLNDYDGSDEVLMCGALEAFDSLNSALNNNANDKASAGNKDARKAENVPQASLIGDDEEPAGGQQQVDTSSPPAQQTTVPNLIDF